MEGRFSSWLRKRSSDISNQRVCMIEDFEKASGDVYKMSAEKAYDMLNHLTFKSLNDAVAFVGLINEYCEDYEREIIKIPINKRFSFTKEQLRTCVMERADAQNLISRTEIEMFLNHAISYAEKWLILAPYEGIGSYGQFAEDLTMTMASGINKENGTIKTASGREYKVSDRLIEIALGAAAEDTMQDSLGKVYPTTNIGTIFRYKAIKNLEFDPERTYIRVAKQIQKFRKRTGFDNCTLNALRRSGMITAIRERIGSDVLKASDKEKITDILDRYNESGVLYTTLQNLVRRTRAR